MHKLTLPKLIGHRGLSSLAPENTLASIHAAANAGVQWVEFDVMLSSDGIPVVIHDDSLARTTNGNGYVHTTTISELKTLDAGSWFDEKYADENILTLDEVLALTQLLDLGINIEIKPYQGLEQQTVQQIKVCLEKTNYSPSKLLLSSFSESAIANCQQLLPHLARGLICDNVTQETGRWLRQYDCTSLHINHKSLTDERIAKLKQKIAYLLVFTVNDQQRAELLWQLGVDSIFSDHALEIR